MHTYESTNGAAATLRPPSAVPDADAVNPADPPPPSADGSPGADPSATPPSLDGANGRDAHGRFTKNNPGGPGNPFARRTAACRRALLEAVSDDDLQAIARRLVEQAKGGDVAAAKLVFAYVIGRPTEAVNPDTLDRQEFDQYRQANLLPPDLFPILNGMQPGLAVGLLRAVLPALTARHAGYIKEAMETGVVPAAYGEPLYRPAEAAEEEAEETDAAADSPAPAVDPVDAEIAALLADPPDPEIDALLSDSEPLPRPRQRAARKAKDRRSRQAGRGERRGNASASPGSAKARRGDRTAPASPASPARVPADQARLPRDTRPAAQPPDADRPSANGRNGGRGRSRCSSG